MKLIYATLTTIIIASCAPFIDVIDVNKVPQGERKFALTVRLLPSDAQLPENTEYIGAVEATSCKFMISDPPPSQANATEQLKIKASRIKANAIADFSCVSSGTDAYGTNCWASISCAGTAVYIPKR